MSSIVCDFYLLKKSLRQLTSKFLCFLSMVCCFRTMMIKNLKHDLVFRIKDLMFFINWHSYYYRVSIFIIHHFTF